MAEVADEAGVTRSTAYRYFATRDDLILGMLLNTSPKRELLDRYLVRALVVP